MNFDLLSMKKRSILVMKKSSVYLMSLLRAVLQIIGIVLVIRVMNLHINWLIPVYIIVILLLGLFKLGFIDSMLKQAHEEKTGFLDIFAGFYKKPLKAVVSIIIKQFILFLGFLLLYIPGIFAFYRLRFFYYELMKEDKTIMQCLKESNDLMKGNCIELLKIDLSFIGWYLLNLVTLNIASIYVKPFTTITYVEYYEYLKGKKAMLGKE